MTKEEKKLWYDFLKNLPVMFHRQKIMGDYIVDFYCAEAKLVIEIDGSQHRTPKGMEKDNTRDLYFERCGIQVLRYSNYDINRQFDFVCADILNHIYLNKELGLEV